MNRRFYSDDNGDVWVEEYNHEKGRWIKSKCIFE